MGLSSQLSYLIQVRSNKSTKWLQDLVDEYNEKKNLVELQELIEQVQYEEAF